ncbi:MAG TPA: hypothetical protein VNH20_03640 [Candidatus Dormibacteraeota bacterium]|nr:hypothetical protein [Candidatus Dormibacteraeota bacterium]
MNHLLLGFALCAALLIYPGGLAVLAAALAAGAGRVLDRRRGRPSWRAALLLTPAGSLVGLLLAGMVLAPMPWPDNPVAPVTVSWASGTDFGGLALSLGGLWALLLLGSGPTRRGWVLGLFGAWSLGIILFGLSVGSASWSGLLSAGGLGAEVGRVGLCAWVLGSLALTLRGNPEGEFLGAIVRAAGGGLVLLLAFPQLQRGPFPVVLGLWWALVFALDLVRLALASWWPGEPRPGAAPAAAATLNVP